MAELSYNDVTRAAQDGTRDIFSQLQRLQQIVQQMGNVQQAVMQISAIQQQLGAVTRKIQAIDARLDQVGRQTFGTNVSDQRISIMQQDISELKVRFGTFERFAQDMSEYIRNEAEQ